MLEKILGKINLSKLNKREKYIVFGIGAALALLIVIQLVVRPLFARTDRLQRQLRAQTAALTEMQKMKAEYDGLTAGNRKSSARFNQRPKGFTLYKFLNRLASETDIMGNMIYMKPTTTEQPNSPFKLSRVEMKLESITLAQLTDYLHRVETSTNMINIRKMVITKKEDKQRLLTAVLQVETLES